MYYTSGRICYKALPFTINIMLAAVLAKGKTIIDWLIDDLESLNVIDEYIIVSNHKFIDSFIKWKDEKQLNNITLLDDGSISNEERCGAVSDIILAIEKLNINEDIMVLAGDNVLDFSLKSFIDYFNSKNHSVVMRYYEENTERIKKGSCVMCDSNEKVLEMIEKPVEPTSNWCVPPFYIYSREDVSIIPKALNEDCNKDAPGSLVNWLYDKSDIYAMKMPGKRYDIGTVESYEKVKTIYKGINN